MSIDLIRRNLLYRSLPLTFKELFVDDPLIPESKARTVESVTDEIGFNPHTAFNNAPITRNKMKKCCLLALAKDTPNLSSFRIRYFNQTMTIFEDGKQVLTTSTYPITYNWISADSTKYIVLYGNEINWAEDSPRILKVKWLVLGDVKFSACAPCFRYDFGVSYYRDDSLGGKQVSAMIAHKYSGGGQLRFPDSLEYINSSWLREGGYSGITSYRIPAGFKGYQSRPYAFYNSSGAPKAEYIHFLGTFEDWLRVDMDVDDSNYVLQTKCFGNGKAVLKCGDNYETPTIAVFPADISTIGARVLDSLPQFTEIHIPANVQTIKQRAFINTINADIYVDKTLEDYKQISFGMYWHNMDATRDLYLQNQKITEVAINSDEELKGDYRSPFESFSIEKLTIADDVTTIPINAFRKCNLKEINWGAGLTKISAYAFQGGCTSEVLEIPEGVTEVGSWAFDGIKGYTKEIILPSTLNTVGSYAFNLGNQGNDVKIWINNPNAQYSSVVFNAPANWVAEVHFAGNSEQWCKIGFTELSMYNLWLEGEPVVNVTVKGVEVARRYLFNGCYSIRSIIVEEGVKTINMYALSARYATYLELPESFQKAEGYCLGGIGNLGEGITIKFKWTNSESILNPAGWNMTSGSKVTLQVPQGMTQAYRDAGYTEALWPNMIEY